MDGLSKFKRRVKCTSAILLAALITSSCAGAALVPASAAEVAQTPSESASMLSNEDRGVIFANSRTDFRDESIYFLITTRFYDGDSTNNATTSEDAKANSADDPSWRGDFKGLIDKLDYIKALGFTAIWITPVVENNSGYDYHGYHAYDFSAVDTRYESNGVTYQTLIDACHAKGMKVIQDIVLNHTCNWGERNLLQIDNPVYGGGRSNYVMAAGASLDPENIYHHNGFCGGGDWDNQEAQKKTIADDCFDLNTENPKVYNYLVNCYTNYINMGVDAFRIDTVKHISRLTFNSVFLPAFKQAGGDKFYMFGEICTKGHDVWYRDCPPISTCFYTWDDEASWKNQWSTDQAANAALLDSHYQAHMSTGSQPTSNNAFLNGNEYHTPDYSMRSGMDAIDFQMHWSFNSAGGAFSTALGEDQYFNDATWNVVYVDSHDYGPDECQTLRYTGDTSAWAENLALMFSFRGIPCIYYGSEIEFQKGKEIDKGPNLALANSGRAYFGDHIEGTVDTNDFTVFGNLSGEVENTLNYTLSQHIMRLNRIRQAVPALRKGQYSTEGCNGSMAFKRRYTDSNTDSFACVCISGGATFSGIPNGTYVDAVTGDVQTVSGGTLTANCSGKGNMRVYVLNTTKTPAPGRVVPNGEFLTDGGVAELIGPVPIYHDEIDATGITLDQTTLSLTEGAAAKLNATIAPANCTKKTVTWTSSNPSVASVSGGTVTAVGIGTTKITATTHNGFTATCTVTVKEDTNKPTGITLDKTTLSVEAGSSASLTATVQPANASNKTVT
ncbi:MAG: Ig-like domain-containing protein, partial [Clostridia bacterium]|nr:Ig-like domain-containing protein [Clostridia bacterium]